MSKKQLFRVTRFIEPSPYELYLPEGPGPFPLICLTPILGRLTFLEDLFLERRFARFFAGHGFAAALFERPFFQVDPAGGIEQIRDYLEEIISRNQRILDFLLTHSEIDPHQIGSFGISFGAVINTIWAARDPRLRAHVFALAGGNLPEIFLTSRDPLMQSYLTSVLKGLHLDRDELKSALQQAFRLDPLEAARSVSKENVFMVIALWDRVIRPRYAFALREALGKPKTLFLPLGHYTSILAIPILKWSVLGFFKRKLSRP